MIYLAVGRKACGYPENDLMIQPQSPELRDLAPRGLLLPPIKQTG